MISFFVAGTPRPGGSKRAGRGRTAGGFTKIVESGKYTAAWREAVGWAGQGAMRKGQPLPGGKRTPACKPFSGPLYVVFTFTMPRPRRPTHQHPVGRPDVTKLVRAAEDALTGVCWVDDAQIVSQNATKWYADDSGEHPAGLFVEVCRFPPSPYEGPFPGTPPLCV